MATHIKRPPKKKKINREPAVVDHNAIEEYGYLMYGWGALSEKDLEYIKGLADPYYDRNGREM